VESTELRQVAKAIEFQLEKVEKRVHMFGLVSEGDHVRFAAVLHFLEFEVVIVLPVGLILVVNHAIRIKLLVCANHLMASLLGCTGQYSSLLP
jgi:hypothetical protein